MKKYDVLIIGAGAAGLSAAARVISTGRLCGVIDMGPCPGRKIRISGGGRCNITNMAASYDRYWGTNPNFVRGALGRVSPTDILAWARRHHLAPVESEPGRYFCDAGAAAVVDALVHDAQGADMIFDTPVTGISHPDGAFTVHTSRGDFIAPQLIVATGGISYPNLGVSDIGYRIAKQFGHKINPPRPGLVALVTSLLSPDLAGISVPSVKIDVGRTSITDALLITHNGIGGPAAYRASLHDLSGGIYINFLPHGNIADDIQRARHHNGRRHLGNLVGDLMPLNLGRWLVGNTGQKNIADLTTADMNYAASRIHRFYIPGDAIARGPLAQAEVTYGGVDTHDISSKTMESKLCPGLYFAGEVLDVTGDLGGFNLHWAWASGRVAGDNAAKN